MQIRSPIIPKTEMSFEEGKSLLEEWKKQCNQVLIEFPS